MCHRWTDHDSRRKHPVSIPSSGILFVSRGIRAMRSWSRRRFQSRLAGFSLCHPFSDADYFEGLEKFQSRLAGFSLCHIVLMLALTGCVNEFQSRLAGFSLCHQGPVYGFSVCGPVSIPSSGILFVSPHYHHSGSTFGYSFNPV